MISNWIILDLRSYGHWLQTSKSVKWQPCTQSFCRKSFIVTLRANRSKISTFCHISQMSTSKSPRLSLSRAIAATKIKSKSTVLLRINAWGVHLIFYIFFFFGGGGVYSREAFTQGRRLLKNTEKVTILYINVNAFVVFFYPKNGIICFINVWICDQIERVRTIRFV